MSSLPIRDIAIIAHVDHGKTTLVDHLLKQSGVFRSNQIVAERMMDSLDLERERGITIAAKNASMVYEGVKINIVDTPGHSDFGGEVERVLNMVDGAILLVDASEGPLPQTRFVLKKALESNLKIIVCINKIDRSDSRIKEVLEEIFELFIDLDATDEQTDYPVVYTVAREGWAVTDLNEKGKDLTPLFQLIIDKIPPPKGDPELPLQLLVANIGYNDYVGRLAIGKVRQGRLKTGSDVLILKENNITKKTRVSALFGLQGTKQVSVEQVDAGDIAIIAGVEDITIGDTICSLENPNPLPRINVEEPTVSMLFSVNNGPFAGLEGEHVTSRKILERLNKELKHNVSLKLEPTQNNDAWKVLGRGELQLAILIEQMRREGFELLVSKPRVLLKKEGDVIKEPTENLVIDVPLEYVGIVTEKLGLRKGIMNHMSNKGFGRVRLEFHIPSRGLIGYRSQFLTDTRGTGLLNTYFKGYEPFRGQIVQRVNGALIADRRGKAIPYAIYNLEPRGVLFVPPGTECYEGMIVGEHSKDNDLIINISREKKLTNVRASGSDEAIRLTPVKPISLEWAMEWINDDELIEVTPKNIRLRCVELNPHKRKAAAKIE